MNPHIILTAFTDHTPHTDETQLRSPIGEEFWRWLIGTAHNIALEA